MSKTVTIRKAIHEDLPEIEKLITRFVEDGILLPRTFQELEELLDTLFIAEIEGLSEQVFVLHFLCEQEVC